TLRCASRASAVGYSCFRVTAHADVAQLVERNLAKVEVARSNLVVRSVSEGPGHRPGPSPFPRFSQSQSTPVRRSYASTYLARVASTTCRGSGGGGCSAARSQPDSAEVSQSRTYCLSYDGCARPGSHGSAGQKREESGVSTSAATTRVSPSKPNSNLVSARTMPRSRAMSRAREYAARVA